MAVVVRQVFQAKYGRGGELVALFKEMQAAVPERAGGMRVMTDAAGPFFTVVTEAEVESIAAWEQMSQELFGEPQFEEWFRRMVPLVEHGRREFWRLEA